MHAGDPVEWHTWSKETFELARRLERPLFVSIGYSTCHWCHVMQRESFQNEEIAALLNSSFVAVKVDKEELPHIDNYFQQIYKRRYGKNGGWPLNVFMTPQKEVFYISGYIPPRKKNSQEGLSRLLPRLAKLYRQSSALKRAVASFQRTDTIMQANSSALGSLKKMRNRLLAEYDDIFGGFGESVKFPQAQKLALMLDLALLLNDKELFEAFYHTLDVMATQGIYDSVEGGWFRYSVDASWEIPHFEKMLYTQAEMIALYARAYRYSKKALYKEVVIQTVAMLQEHFKAPNDLYYSAVDAQSDHREGAYYLFEKRDILRLLHDDPNKKELTRHFGGFEENFGPYVHLVRQSTKQPPGYGAFMKKLRALRHKHPYPFVDKKIILSWNAMLAEALLEASSIDEAYALQGYAMLHRLKELFMKEGVLYHYAINGRPATQAGELLEDYAAFVHALLKAYETSLEYTYLGVAQYLFERSRNRFYKNGMLYAATSGNYAASKSDRYHVSEYSLFLHNAAILAHIKEQRALYGFVQKELPKHSKGVQTPALLRLSVMMHSTVYVLRNTKNSLLAASKRIAKIRYPYLLVDVGREAVWSLCSIKQCFIHSKRFEDVSEFLEKMNN